MDKPTLDAAQLDDMKSGPARWYGWRDSEKSAVLAQARAALTLRARVAELESVLLSRHGGEPLSLLDELTKERQRVAELEADCARYHDERNEALGLNDYCAQTLRDLTTAIREQKAHANALRDALEQHRGLKVGLPLDASDEAIAARLGRIADWEALRDRLLATTPRASLAAHDAEVRKAALREAADICAGVEADASDEDEIVVAEGARECEYQIRALAAQEVKP